MERRTSNLNLQSQADTNSARRTCAESSALSTRPDLKKLSFPSSTALAIPMQKPPPPAPKLPPSGPSSTRRLPPTQPAASEALDDVYQRVLEIGNFEDAREFDLRRAFETFGSMCVISSPPRYSEFRLNGICPRILTAKRFNSGFPKNLGAASQKLISHLIRQTARCACSERVLHRGPAPNTGRASM